MAVVSARVVIDNEKGFHARSATAFMTVASRFESTVAVENVDNGVLCDGKSIMSLLRLVAGYGTEIEIRASGPDAEAAVGELVRLVEAKFLE